MKTHYKCSHPCENRLREPELIFNFFLKERQLDGFSHENPNPVLRVLNKFGSLVPLVLLLHMGLLVLAPLVLLSLGAAAHLLLLLLFFKTSITLLPLLFLSLYCYYSSPIITSLSLLLLLFSLLLLFFSHCSYLFPVAITLLTWCCSFPLMK